MVTQTLCMVTKTLGFNPALADSGTSTGVSGNVKEGGSSPPLAFYCPAPPHTFGLPEKCFLCSLPIQLTQPFNIWPQGTPVLTAALGLEILSGLLDGQLSASASHMLCLSWSHLLLLDHLKSPQQLFTINSVTHLPH